MSGIPSKKADCPSKGDGRVRLEEVSNHDCAKAIAANAEAPNDAWKGAQQRAAMERKERAGTSNVHSSTHVAYKDVDLEPKEMVGFWCPHYPRRDGKKGHWRNLK